MRQILIIGKNSYVGQHICLWLESKADCKVCEFDVQNKPLEEIDFTEFDTVIHVAAIVHKRNVKEWEHYKRVNVDLPTKVAICAKDAGVKQFIYISSMAIWGKEKCLPIGNRIDQTTPYSPRTMYAKSKYLAELQLHVLESATFSIAYVRPANIYGYGCRGNYINGYQNLVRMLPIIPSAFSKAKQGLLYIDNFCELIRLIVINERGGYFQAQDALLVSAVELMRSISRLHHCNNSFPRALGWLLYPLQWSMIIKKIYGGVAYDETFARTDLGIYQIVNYDEAIKSTLPS